MESEETAVSQPENFLGQLDTLDGYRRYFTDPGLWRPYVQLVCSRHLQTPCRVIRSGLPGTCPTFIVDERWVVKFFGRLFDGALGFDTELQVNRLLMASRPVPVPDLIASGCLLEGTADWPWPYLIYEFIPSVSIGEVCEQVTFDDKLKLAQDLGEITRRLHALPITNTTIFQAIWDAYLNLLQVQRSRCITTHQTWNTLPARLIEQIDTFLLPIDLLVDRNATPHLIHADLTRDHILGRLEEGVGSHWASLTLVTLWSAIYSTSWWPCT